MSDLNLASHTDIAPPPRGTPAAQQYEAPQGDVEQAIAEIWKDLLGLERVGRSDHFFELGGRSSLAMSLFFRLRQGMRVNVGMRELFHEPVLRSFAATVSQRIEAAACAA